MLRPGLAATLALLATPTLAERVEVVCAGSSPFLSNTTLCDTRGRFVFQSDGPEVPFFVTVTAPATHCSDVSYMMFRPGEEASIGFSDRMAPGASQTVEIGAGFGPGEAVIEVAAIGHIGGCNTGAIQSWAVDISAAPVP